MSENNDLNEAKELSLGYFMTGAAILGVAVILGFVVRLSQTGILGNVPALYYTLMSLHGIAAFVGWGCFASMGLTWYALVKGLESPLHSPRLVKTIYWVFITGVVLIVVAALFGNFGGSWVFLYPISMYGYWPTWAAFTWNLGVTLAGVAIILYGYEIIMTVRKAGYGFWDALGFEAVKDSKWKEGVKRVPLAVVPLMVIGWGMIIATIPFAVLLIYSMLELVGAVGPMNALLAKNMLWWFGHPVVYLILFPVVSFFYTLVKEYTGNDLIGERMTKYAWMIATIVQNFIGAHHVYADLAQAPWIHFVSQLGTYAIILPSVLSIYSITSTLYVYKWEWNTSMKYLFVSIMFWLLAGASGWVNATPSLNEYIHNSLWVVAHFHTMAVLALSTMIFGMAFHIMENHKGLHSADLASKALWTYVISGVGFVHLWFIQGLWGGIRRSYASTPENLTLFTWLSLIFALFFAGGLLLNVWLSYMSIVKPEQEAVTEAVPA